MNFWRPCHRLPNPHLPPPPNPPLFLLVPAMCIPPLSLSNMKRKGKIFFLIGKLYTHPMGFEPTISLLPFEPKLNGRMNLFLIDCLLFLWGGGERIGRGGLSSNPSSQAPHKRCRNHRDIPQTLIDCHIFLKEAYSPSCPLAS